jgi:hypothetical protein
MHDTFTTNAHLNSTTEGVPPYGVTVAPSAELREGPFAGAQFQPIFDTREGT